MSCIIRCMNLLQFKKVKTEVYSREGFSLLSQFTEDDFSRLESQTLYTKREKLWFAVVNIARTTSKTPKVIMHFFSTLS
jgi:hypothetical protein